MRRSDILSVVVWALAGSPLAADQVPTTEPAAALKEEQNGRRVKTERLRHAATRGVVTPAQWGPRQIQAAMSAKLWRMADARLPGALVVDRPGDRTEIYWRTGLYDVPRPVSKGWESAMDIRREVGPLDDGLIVSARTTAQKGQAARPQVLDNAGLWRTYLGTVPTGSDHLFLDYNVAYGPRTDRAVVGAFASGDWAEQAVEEAPQGLGSSMQLGRLGRNVDESSLKATLGAQLLRMAQRDLPGFVLVQEPQDVLCLVWKAKDAGGSRPAACDADHVLSRCAIDPGADGLVVLVWAGTSTHLPPSALVRDRRVNWQTYLTTVTMDSPHIEVCAAVSYGPKTSRALIDLFAGAGTWMKEAVQPAAAGVGGN
jgi:hypothetical protein